MKPEAFPAKTAALVPYVKEDFFVKDKKNTPQVLARRALLVLLDAAIVAFSFYFALLLRADGAVEAAWWPHNRELLYENLPWIVAVYIASFLFSGLYSVLWKYAGERDLMRLAGTVAVLPLSSTVSTVCASTACCSTPPTVWRRCSSSCWWAAASGMAAVPEPPAGRKATWRCQQGPQPPGDDRRCRRSRCMGHQRVQIQ